MNVAKIVNIGVKVIEWTVFAVLLVAFFVLLSPLLPTKQYVSTYVISTGSMEPTLPVGSIALATHTDASQVQKGDIITFSSPSEPSKTIIHRVISVQKDGGSVFYKTKGDNNNAPDRWDVYPMHIKGKHFFTVPYLGHIVAFMQTKVGFLVAIGIPAMLLAIVQIKKIKEGIDEEIEKRIAKKAKDNQIVNTILIILLGNITALFMFQNAIALYTAQAQVSGINITVKDFVPPALPIHLSPEDNSTQTITSFTFDWTDVSDYSSDNNPVYYIFQLSSEQNFTSPFYTSGELVTSEISSPILAEDEYWWRVKACDAIDNCTDWTTPWKVTYEEKDVQESQVVINEIMWMGSTSHHQDEWIELRNMTNQTIDINGWYLTGAGAGASIITLTGSIAPNSYYLIINYNSTSHPQSALKNGMTVDQAAANLSFLNDGEVITLFDSEDVLVDQTPSGIWAAGENGTLKKSMQRNSDPSTGWHTCDDPACNDTTYWDTEGNNYGTPRSVNHSDNDISIRPAFPLILDEVIEETAIAPSLNAWIREDKRAVGFMVDHIQNYDSLRYEIMYKANGEDKGIVSTVDLEDEDSLTRSDLLLGTCSSAGVVCVYDENIDVIAVHVYLTKDEEETELIQEITYTIP